MDEIFAIALEEPLYLWAVLGEGGLIVMGEPLNFGGDLVELSVGL